MTDIVSLLTSSLTNDVDRLEVISRNLANLETTAYKRDMSVQEFRGLLSDSLEHGVEVEGIESSVVADHAQGTLKATGSDLDLAIDGKGFFVVRNQDSELLTRRGDFGVSSEGFLVVDGNKTLLGNGAPVYVGVESFEVKKDGTVFQKEDIISKLDIAEFADGESGNYLGKGFYSGENIALAGELGGSTKIQQGYLEASNVSVMDEVVKMMELTRHFETSHVALKSYDSMLDVAINKVGEV
jgi:flagellar basal-body rod protein FlgG